MSIPIVVLDPGHGGTREIGGSSPNNATGPNGLLEKNLTLDIAQRVAAALAGRAQVILTRTDDSNLSLADRAAVARTNNALLFLSIHLNGWRDAQVDGTEIYVAPTASDKSRGFALRVLSRLLAVTQVANRGVKQQDFGVLKPARHAHETGVCLAEIAFLTNPAQARRLESADYRQTIAGALAAAIGQYLPAEHYLHHDAARPDRRIPPPVPFSLATLPHTYWAGAQSYDRTAAAALDSRIRFVLRESVGRGGRNKGDDVEALKERLGELGYNWLPQNRSMDNDTIQAIRLFQSIIAGDPDKAIAGDGLVDVPGKTYRWLQAANAPRWQLMPAGSPADGFDNIELPNTTDQHDYGTQWLADTLRAAGRHYRDNYLNTHPKAALLTINDVSLPHGGDTPEHGGHERGMACDLRLPRTDGTAPAGTTFEHPKYDQAATRAMLQALRAQPLHSHIYFNDPVLIGEGLCRKTRPGDHVHDNHIHLAIKPPEQAGIELVDVRPGVAASLVATGAGGSVGAASASDRAGYAAASWARGFDAPAPAPCGCAHCADCASPATRALDKDTPPACASTKAVPAGETADNCKLLLGTKGLAHGTVTPNLFLRWNDIPAGTCEVDVVVHFHGYGIEVKDPATMKVTAKVPVSGLDFDAPPPVKEKRKEWTDADEAAAKRARKASPVRRNRPTLCILPLGRHTSSFFKADPAKPDKKPPRDSMFDFPFFTGERTGLEQIINYALALLAKRATQDDSKPVTFKRCRLILTAHSGGGAALARVLAHRKGGQRYYDVSEVHLFDATYGNEDTFAQWAKDRIDADVKESLKATDMPTRGGALRVLYLPCSGGWRYDSAANRCTLSETETHARYIQSELEKKLGASFLNKWYRVEQVPRTHKDTTDDHMEMPQMYGFQLLDNAGSDLTPAPIAQPNPPACCPDWPRNCPPAKCAGMPKPAADVRQPTGAGR